MPAFKPLAACLQAISPSSPDLFQLSHDKNTSWLSLSIPAANHMSLLSSRLAWNNLRILPEWTFLSGSFRHTTLRGLFSHNRLCNVLCFSTGLLSAQEMTELLNKIIPPPPVMSAIPILSTNSFQAFISTFLDSFRVTGSSSRALWEMGKGKMRKSVSIALLYLSFLPPPTFYVPITCVVPIICDVPIAFIVPIAFDVPITCDVPIAFDAPIISTSV